MSEPIANEQCSEQPTVLPAGLPAPVPMSDRLDVPHLEALQRHELVVQKCRGCSKLQWGPEHLCHRCLSFELDWHPVDPVGRIFSWQRVWHPTFPALRDAVPYLIVLVELDDADGIRFFGNVVGRDHPDIEIGMPVTGVFEDHHGPDGPYSLLQWELTEQ